MSAVDFRLGFDLGFAFGVWLRLLLLLSRRGGGGPRWRRFVGHIGLRIAFGLLSQPTVGAGHVLPLGADFPINFLLGFGIALRGQGPVMVCGSHSAASSPMRQMT